MSNQKWVTVSPTPLPTRCKDLLRSIGDLVEFDNRTAADFAVALRTADAAIARGDTIFDETRLSQCGRLKVIGRTGVGVELVDLQAATRRGIPVVVTPNANSAAVAEGAMAMILTLVKRLGDLDSLVRSGEWEQRDMVRVGDIEGSVFGIVGLGSIGRRVADIAHVFKADVLAYDPMASADVPDWIEMVPLEILAERADITSIHAPGGPKTQGLIGDSFFGHAKRGMILVNLARGSVLDESALLRALDDGIVAAAGLDVMQHEPPLSSDPLLARHDVLLSPHKLALSEGATAQVFGAAATGIVDVALGRRPATVANPEVFR